MVLSFTRFYPICVNYLLTVYIFTSDTIDGTVWVMIIPLSGDSGQSTTLSSKTSALQCDMAWVRLGIPDTCPTDCMDRITSMYQMCNISPIESHFMLTFGSLWNEEIWQNVVTSRVHVCTPKSTYEFESAIFHNLLLLREVLRSGHF